MSSQGSAGLRGGGGGGGRGVGWGGGELDGLARQKQYMAELVVIIWSVPDYRQAIYPAEKL